MISPNQSKQLFIISELKHKTNLETFLKALDSNTNEFDGLELDESVTELLLNLLKLQD